MSAQIQSTKLRSACLTYSQTVPRFKPQTQQGADILADNLNAQILMPDFFEPGEPWPVDQFPPKTDEEKQKLQEFFGGIANPHQSVEKALSVAKALKAEGVEFVGLYGYCWGASLPRDLVQVAICGC